MIRNFKMAEEGFFTQADPNNLVILGGGGKKKKKRKN